MGVRSSKRSTARATRAAPRRGTASAKGGATAKTSASTAATRRSAATRAQPSAGDRMEAARGPKLLELPDVRQATIYSCGASSLQAVLVYFGKSDDRELYLADECKTTPDWGTEPKDIKRVAEEYGLKAEMREGLSLDDLRRYVAREQPVMIAYQAWRDEDNTTPWKDCWDDGHYSVVIGIDDDNVYLEDPSLIGEVGYIPHAEFMERWHDIDKDGHKLRQFGIVFSSKKPRPKLGRITKID